MARALRSHRRGREFDSHHLHQDNLTRPAARGAGLTRRMTRRRVGRRLAVGMLVVLAGVVATACADSPESAGNATVDFFMSIQTSDYKHAYSRLCESQRAAVSFDDFEASKGGNLGDPSRLQSGLLEGEQYEDVKTLDSNIREAWTEWVGFDGRVFRTSRVSLVREGGKWRVCDVEFASESPTSPHTFGP